MWVRHCGSTRGRLCPNHSEPGLHGGQSEATQVCKQHYSIIFPQVIFKVLHTNISASHLLQGDSPLVVNSHIVFPGHHLSLPCLPICESLTLSLRQPWGSLSAQWAGLILTFMRSSSTERFELYQRWRLLVILRIPFPHREQLFVRGVEDVESQPHIFPLWLFFWWDYCTLFLEIFIQNCIVSMSPRVSIKASLLAVITGIQKAFEFVCLWKCFWTLSLTTRLWHC